MDPEKQRYAVIGYPLDHSFSPRIHNPAFRSLNLNAEYGKIEIAPADFDAKIQNLKREHWNGFNVTVPYKQRIIKELDDMDPLAKRIGAINTIRVGSGGEWFGTNTDYRGFLEPLLQMSNRLDSVLLIGAGGAARAVAFGLLAHYNLSRLDIVNRTVERAAALRADLCQFKKISCTVSALSETKPADTGYDVIVNSTSVGMGRQSHDVPMDPLPYSHEKTIVYDLIYNPEQTMFLKRSREHGLATINGLPMLVYQAAASFKIWTGKDFPSRIIKDLLSSPAG